MDKSELSMKMLEWEKLQNQIKALEKEIQTAVLEIGKTFDVGNIRASYSAGRREFNYQEACKDADPGIIDKCTTRSVVIDYEAIFKLVKIPHDILSANTTLSTSIDWKAVCDEIGIEKDKIPLLSQKPPSVTVKFKD